MPCQLETQINLRTLEKYKITMVTQYFRMISLTSKSPPPPKTISPRFNNIYAIAFNSHSKM